MGKLRYLVQVPAAMLVGRGAAEDVVVEVVDEEPEDVVVVVVVSVIEMLLVLVGAAIATQYAWIGISGYV